MKLGHDVLEQTLPGRQPTNVTRLRSCRFEYPVKIWISGKKKAAHAGTKCTRARSAPIAEIARHRRNR